LGEHRPYKPRVTGSSPVPPTIWGCSSVLVRAPACQAGGREFKSRHSRHFNGGPLKLAIVLITWKVWSERPVNHDGKVVSSSLVTPAILMEVH
jgi:hypothetical protein